LIGNKILVIYDGTTAAGPIQEGDVLGNETQLSTEEIMETFQKNNMNVLAITEKLKAGEGTLGRLINSDDVYLSIASAANSIRVASDKAQRLTESLNEFSNKLNTEGNLANDIATDTVLFKSMSHSVMELEKTMDSVNVFVSNLKKAAENPRTPVGVLLYDEKAGKELKSTIGNLESGSQKLDENLEALKHSFLLRKYFRKKEKEQQKEK
jgi:phospholipid/cholesterol/gamma-HCH transport system substrate-binding protein